MPIRNNGRLAFRRHELTWGDVNSVTNALAVVTPSNHSSLLSAFGVSLDGPKDLQVLRNTIAHKNPETFAELSNILTRYQGGRIWQPSDLLQWEYKSYNDYAYLAWIVDLKAIASNACN